MSDGWETVVQVMEQKLLPLQTGGNCSANILLVTGEGLCLLCVDICETVILSHEGNDNPFWP